MPPNPEVGLRRPAPHNQFRTCALRRLTPAVSVVLLIGCSGSDEAGPPLDPADTVAPGPILDLAAEEVAARSARLSWT
ncbi:MAG: hypothetical protein GF346_00120, partial [Candidatus Eisenbacteria bacterium]|nr:hypothetical protein [Candidatus Latescibacterota bacterium]MBD3300837.1 hypothetical protein [Candidatus Eisenbacteria bacterium]